MEVVVVVVVVVVVHTSFISTDIFFWCRARMLPCCT